MHAVPARSAINPRLPACDVQGLRYRTLARVPVVTAHPLCQAPLSTVVAAVATLAAPQLTLTLASTEELVDIDKTGE